CQPQQMIEKTGEILGLPDCRRTTIFVCGGLLQSRCSLSRVCSLFQLTRRCAAVVVAVALAAGFAWAAASGPAVDFLAADFAAALQPDPEYSRPPGGRLLLLLRAPLRRARLRQ